MSVTLGELVLKFCGNSEEFNANLQKMRVNSLRVANSIEKDFKNIKSPHISLDLDDYKYKQKIYDIKKTNERKLKIETNVDEDQIDGLNKKIDSIQERIKNVNSWVKRNPIKYNADYEKNKDVSRLRMRGDDSIKQPSYRYYKKTNKNYQSEPETSSDYRTKEIQDNKKVINNIKGGSSQRGFLGSIGIGAFENFGKNLTDKITMGLSNSIEDSLSGGIGSFELLGKSIIEKIIPKILEQLGEVEELKDVKKEFEEIYEELDINKVFKEYSDVVKSTIGDEDVDVENLIKRKEKRDNKLLRKTTSAREIGEDYKKYLESEYTKEIDQKIDKQEIKRLNALKEKYEQESDDIKNTNPKIKVTQKYQESLEKKDKELEEIRQTKQALEEESEILINKAETLGLTPEEGTKIQEMEQKYQTLEEKEEEVSTSREKTDKDFLKFLSDPAEEIQKQQDLDGKALNQFTAKITEIQTKINELNRKSKNKTDDGERIENLLKHINVEGSEELRTKRSLADIAIKQKKKTTKQQKDIVNEDLKKATALLTNSREKIQKYEQKLTESIRDSDDETSYLVKELIKKEKKKEKQFQTISENFIKKIEDLEIEEKQFIKRAEASVPEAQKEIIKSAGVKVEDDNFKQSLKKNNLKKVLTERNKIMTRLKSYDFEGKKELDDLISEAELLKTKAEEINKSIMADGGIRKKLKSADEKGLQIKKKLDKPSVYKLLVKEVASLSGTEISEDQIPELKLLDPKFVAKREAAGHGVGGSYSNDTNTINLTEKQYKELMADDITKISDHTLEILSHELRHGVQNSFSKEQKSLTDDIPIELLKPNKEDFNKNPNLAARIESSSSNASISKGLETKVRALEQDAYTFEARNRDQIIENVRRQSLVEKIEGDVGIGGAKLYHKSQQEILRQTKSLAQDPDLTDIDTDMSSELIQEHVNIINRTLGRYVESLQVLDDLPYKELVQLERDINAVAEGVKLRSENLHRLVKNDVIAKNKQQLQEKLTGAFTPKPELISIARNNEVGVGGTKEEISKRLIENVPIPRLIKGTKTLSNQDKAIIRLAKEYAEKSQNQIVPIFQEKIKKLKNVMDSSDVIPPGLIPNLEINYSLVLEILSNGLEEDVRKYLKGASLQIAKLRKRAYQESEQFNIWDESLDPEVNSTKDTNQKIVEDYVKKISESKSEELDDTEFTQLEMAVDNPIKLTIDYIKNLLNENKPKNNINSTKQSNNTNSDDFQQVYEKGQNDLNETLEELFKSLQDHEKKTIENIKNHFDEKLEDYEEIIRKAEEYSKNIQSPDTFEARQKKARDYAERQRFKSEQELKGYHDPDGYQLNNEVIKTPEKVAEEIGKPVTNKFKLSIAESLNNLFSGVAKRIKKQAKILEMHSGSLVTDLESSASQAHLDGDEEEYQRLKQYSNRVQTNQKRSSELLSLENLSDNQIKELDKLNEEILRIYDSLNVAVPEVHNFFDAISNAAGSVDNTNSVLGRFGQTINSILTGVTALTFFNKLRDIVSSITPELINAAVRMESLRIGFGFVSNSAAEAITNFDRVRSVVKNLGGDLQEGLEGYVGLAASTKGTSLEGKSTDDLFKAINQAGSVYSLNQEQMQGAFRAFQQIASKGKVQAEELRGQLAERIPGIFQLVARAIGVSTKELNKMLQRGEIISEEVLPKIAAQLSAETSVGIAAAANSSISALNRFNNSLFELKAGMGEGLLPARNIGLKALSTAMDMAVKHAGTLMNIISFLSTMLGFSLAKSAFLAAKSMGLVSLGAKGLVLGLKTVGSALGGLALKFAAFTAAMKVGEIIYKSFKDAGGKIREFADTSEKSINSYISALESLNKVDVKIQTPRHETLFTDSILGFLPRQADIEDGIFKRLGAGIRNGLAKTENFASKQIFGRFWNTFTGKGFTAGSTRGENVLQQQLLAVRDTRESGQYAQGEALSLIGNGNGTKEIKQILEVNKALDLNLRKRRSLVQLSPGDTKAIKNVENEREQLLEQLEKVRQRPALVQGLLSSQKTSLQSLVQELETKAATPGLGQDEFRNELKITKNELEKLVNLEDKLNKLIGEGATKFSLMKKEINQISRELEDKNFDIGNQENKSKISVYGEQLSGGLSQTQVDSKLQGLKVKSLSDQFQASLSALNQLKGILETQDNLGVLSAYGLDRGSGRAEIGSMAERLDEEAPKDAYILEQFVALKDYEAETISRLADLTQARVESQQQLRESSIAVAQFFDQVERESAELGLSAKETAIQTKFEKQKTKLEAAIGKFGDSFVDEFIDTVLTDIDSQLQESMEAMTLQQEELSNSFNYRDLERQAVELQRNIPDLPSIPVTLDFSGVPTDADLSRLSEEVDSTVVGTAHLADMTSLFENGVWLAGDALNSNKVTTDGITTSLAEHPLKMSEFADEIANADHQSKVLEESLGNQKPIIEENKLSAYEFKDLLSSSHTIVEKLSAMFSAIGEKIKNLAVSTAEWALNLGNAFTKWVGFGNKNKSSQDSGSPESSFSTPSTGDYAIASPSAKQSLEQVMGGKVSKGQSFSATRKRKRGRGYHNGIDFDSTEGLTSRDLVQSMFSGTVKTTSAWGAGYRDTGGDGSNSNAIRIESKLPGGGTFLVDYGHILKNTAKVKDGQKIQAGSKLANLSVDDFASEGGHLDMKIRAPQAFAQKHGIDHRSTAGGMAFVDVKQFIKAYQKEAQTQLSKAPKTQQPQHQSESTRSLSSAGLTSKGKGYLKYLDNPNIRAALDTIARAEGADYRTIYGDTPGQQSITSLAEHPNKRISKGGITSSASGRYQFMDFTWFGQNGNSGLKQQLGLPDFSPEAQDLAAIALLDRRGVLGKILKGDIAGSFKNLGKEWASFEGNPYGQGTREGMKSSAIPYFKQQQVKHASGEILSTSPSTDATSEIYRAAMAKSYNTGGTQGGRTPQGQKPQDINQLISGASVLSSDQQRDMSNSALSQAETNLKLRNQAAQEAAAARQEAERVRRQNAQAQAAQRLERSLLDAERGTEQINRQIRDLGYESQIQTPEVQLEQDLTRNRDQRDDQVYDIESKILTFENTVKKAKAAIGTGLLTPEQVEPLTEAIARSNQQIATLKQSRDQVLSVSKEIETYKKSEYERQQEVLRLENAATQKRLELTEKELESSLVSAQGYTTKATDLERQIELQQKELELQQEIREIEEARRVGQLTNTEADSRISQLQRNLEIEKQITEQQRLREEKERERRVNQFSQQGQLELMDAQISGLQGRGQTFAANDIGRDRALLQQNIDFNQKKVELDQFIISEGIAAEQALVLRQNLEQVNQVKLNNIQEQFHPFKEQLGQLQSSFSGLISGVIKGEEDAFSGFLDSITNMLIDTAAQWATQQIFGGLFGGNNPNGGGSLFGGNSGGGGIGGILGGLFGGGGGGGGFLGSLFGGLFYDGGVVGKNNSGINNLEDAFKREKSMGGKPRLVVASVGERILSQEATNAFDQLMNGSVSNYYRGGKVGQSKANNQTSGSKSSSDSITVKVESQVINSVEYITKDQYEQGLQQTAEQSAKKAVSATISKVRNSMQTRQAMGIR